MKDSHIPRIPKPGGRICVSIGARPGTIDPLADVLVQARQAAAGADVIEIRLDTLAKPTIKVLARELSNPLLFTNRPVWEGGFFKGDEEERLAPLLQAVSLSAAYVDIELNAAVPLRARLLKAARKSKTRLIISWHDFAATPSPDELRQIFYRQAESGCDIGKIVTMAHEIGDVHRVMELLPLARGFGFPLIAFCMGGPGMLSRLATVEMGGYMTYAAPDHGEAMAPGQIPVSVMRAKLGAKR